MNEIKISHDCHRKKRVIIVLKPKDGKNEVKKCPICKRWIYTENAEIEYFEIEKI